MPDPGSSGAAEALSESPGGAESVCDGRGVELPGLEVETEHGLTLRLLQAEPPEQIVGDNAWLFELDQGGEPMGGLSDSVVVTPFMPDHGHGTAVAVSVAEIAPGQYELSPVNLRMPGYWLITVEIAIAEGDTEVAQFGVCVE